MTADGREDRFTSEMTVYKSLEEVWAARAQSRLALDVLRSALEWYADFDGPHVSESGIYWRREMGSEENYWAEDKGHTARAALRILFGPQPAPDAPPELAQAIPTEALRRDGWKPLREWHEEAAGYGLEEMFFRFNHINPDEWQPPRRPLPQPAPEPIIEAQHDETGRMWSGPRSQLPPRFFEIANPPEPQPAPDAPPGLAEAVINSVRQLLIWYKGENLSYGNLRKWPVGRGDISTEGWPEWAFTEPDAAHVTKAAFAILLWHTFKAAEARAALDEAQS